MTAKRLLLIAAVLALLVASGVVWAAATATTYAVVQIPVAIIDPGTTWTEGGVTHLRGQVLETWCYYDYNGDGVDDQWTIAVLTVNNDVDANGAGTGHGTWSEYDIETGDPLGGGTWQAKYTCAPDLAGPEYAFGWVNPLGWRLGPDGEWGQAKATLILYSVPIPASTDRYQEFRGEFRFLVPGG